MSWMLSNTKSTVSAMNSPVLISYAANKPATQAVTPIRVIPASFWNCNRSVKVICLLDLNKKLMLMRSPSNVHTVRTITAKSSSGNNMVSLLSSCVTILQFLIQRKENCKKISALHNIIIKYFTQYVKNMCIEVPKNGDFRDWK